MQGMIQEVHCCGPLSGSVGSSQIERATPSVLALGVCGDVYLKRTT